MTADHPGSACGMPWNRSHMNGRILDLTLEIIYLMTGEVYVPETKPSSHVTPNSLGCVSEGWCKSHSPIMDPPPPSLISERINNKILHVIQKIIELLTGEVPIRCQDVSVYFSMEEWEYLEGHRDLYKDVVMENRPLLTSLDGSRKRKPPERCPRPLYSRDSTREHHEIPHTRPLYSRDSTQEHHVIPQTCPLYSRDSTQEHHVIPQTRPLYSRDSTQEHHDVPHQDQNGVLVDIKVEVKEEEPSVMGDEPWKEEEVPLEISTGGQNSQNNTEDCLSLSRCKIKDIIETSAGSPGDEASSRYLHPDLQVANIPHAPPTHRRHLPAQSRIITHHTSVSGVETCLHSTDSFPQKSSLNLGDASSTDQEPLTCSECEKGFLNRALFLVHCKSHTGEKPYVCPYCGKGFTHKSDFNKHQRIHTGEKPFSCLECGKSFTQKSNHMRHQKVHLAEKPYSCSHCAKGFSQKSNFQRHIQSHSEEKSYSCRECGQHFTLKAHLLQHQTVHRGQKPYCCTECGKYFAHQSSFYRHQKNHTGDKPYACRECGDRFTQSSSLARHQQRHLQLLH